MEGVSVGKKKGDIGLVSVGVVDVTVVLPGGLSYRVGRGGWLTVSDYCVAYGRRLESVLAWISRGHVLDDETVVIPELNDLRLMRDIDYSIRVRPYRRGGVRK